MKNQKGNRFVRKGLALLLAVALLSALFAACDKEEETAPQGEVSDMSGEQHFNIGDIMSNSASSTSSENVSSELSQGSTSEPSEPSGTSETPSTDETHNWSGEFVVTEKKYEHKDTNFMLLNITNDTGTNCDLTITGTFYDESGEVVRIQQQIYHNFPTGWSNYFIFWPQMKFDTFTYELSAKEYENLTVLDSMFSYNGEPLSDRVTVGWIPGVYWDHDPDGTPMLMCRMTRSGNAECEVALFGHILILDGNGDVYTWDFDAWNGDITTDTMTGWWPHIEEDPLYAYDNKLLYWASKDSPEYAEPLPDAESLTFIFAIQGVVVGELFNTIGADGTVNLSDVLPPKNLK